MINPQSNCEKKSNSVFVCKTKKNTALLKITKKKLLNLLALLRTLVDL